MHVSDVNHTLIKYQTKIRKRIKQIYIKKPTKTTSCEYSCHRSGKTNELKCKNYTGNLHAGNAYGMVKPYTRFQSRDHLNMASHSSSKFNDITYCLISFRDTSTLIFCLCRPTVILHQGQWYPHEYEHIRNAIYKSTGMLSLNAIA